MAKAQTNVLQNAAKAQAEAIQAALQKQAKAIQTGWQKIIGNNPSYCKNTDPDVLVEQISWNECQEFCKKPVFPYQQRPSGNMPRV